MNIYLVLLLFSLLPMAKAAEFKKGDEPSPATIAQREISDDLISLFKANRHTHPNKIMIVHSKREGVDHRLTTILSERCEDLLPFANKFTEWSRTLSPISEVGPRCVCEDSVCAIELTDYFPECFKTKIDKRLRLNGPNCCNTSLIARGFLSREQIRFSNEWELGFYLRTYCREVAITERQTHDIVLSFTGVNGSFNHCGFYINDDILFTKGSPAKTSLYSLENWTHKFKNHPESLGVYRCDAAGLQQISRKIRGIETTYTPLIDTELSETSLKQQLISLQKRAAQIDESSLSEPNKLALSSLKSSLNMSINKQVMIKGEKNSVLVLAECIKSIKKSLQDTAHVPDLDSLQIGDLVTVECSIGFMLKPDQFYQVLDIL